MNGKHTVFYTFIYANHLHFLRDKFLNTLEMGHICHNFLDNIYCAGIF